MIDYDRFYPGMPTDLGVLLTENQEFIRFEIDKREDIIELIMLENLTNQAKYKIENKVKGIGKSFGLIAIEVFEEINSVKQD